ncbi:unnamed protein product [Mucor hiemalis]
MTNASNNNKKVIIIGGGLAGLTFANSLKTHGIPFEVYERDEHADAREQGWGISIHFALPSLKQCMPKESFENLYQKISANPETDAAMSFCFLNANTNEVYMSQTAKPGQSYRANRSRLRRWLLEPIKEHVHWNKRLSHYKENKEEGTVTAYFEDGSETTGDLLVGTDGIQSPVACQLAGGKEIFDKVTTSIPARCFGVLRWMSEEEWYKIAKEPVHVAVLNGKQGENENDPVKEKTFNMFCTIHDIDRSRTKDPIRVLWTISRYDPEGAIPQFNDPKDPECLALIKTWAVNGLPEDSLYRSLILDTPDDAQVMNISVREREPTEDLLVAPQQRVVLVGDSAHPMTMFKGEGGNHAMVDAVNLGNQLSEYYKGEKTLDEALKAYHDEMIPRGSKAVKESHDSAVMVHCYPEKMFKMFSKTASVNPDH